MEFISDSLPQFYTDSNPPGSKPSEGANSPLIFIHGFPHTHELWKDQVTELSKHHRVVTYDLRGFGASAGNDGPLLIDFFADDLFALMDHLGVEDAHVCGLSMGGYIALRAVERFPKRFRSLILCDTAYKADTNAAKEKRANQIRQLRAEGLLAFAESYSDGVLTPETLVDLPEKLPQFRAMILQNSAKAVANGLVAMAARTDSTETLGKIGIPTLIVVGERDPVTPVSIAQEMQTAIRGSRLEIIPRVGHLSNFEAPDAFNSKLLHFLTPLKTS